MIPAQRFRPPDGGNAPTPTAPSARKAQAGKNSFPQTPFLFARLFAGFARFFGGRATNQKGWRVGLENLGLTSIINLTHILIFYNRVLDRFLYFLI